MNQHMLSNCGDLIKLLAESSSFVLGDRARVDTRRAIFTFRKSATAPIGIL